MPKILSRILLREKTECVYSLTRALAVRGLGRRLGFNLDRVLFGIDLRV